MGFSLNIFALLQLPATKHQIHVDIQPLHRAAGKVTEQKKNPSRARSRTAWAKLHVQQELGEDTAEADLQEYLVLLHSLLDSATSHSR